MSAEKQQTPSSAEDGGAKSFAATQTKTAEEAPDPDEDDLDELDDVLDEFAASKAKSPAETSTIGKPAAGEPGGGADGPAGLSAEDFDDQLAKEMAKLMGDVDSNPEMKKQIDEMMKELGSVMEQQMGTENAAAPTGVEAGAKSEAGAPTEDSFAETIRKTMERMQASGDKATAEASAESNDDFMTEMLKQLSGNGGDEDFSKMLLGMMEQLTNKEILYEPMKELHEKFPAWMEANQEKTKAEDLTRYKKQQKLVGEIVGRFEKTGYSDENGEDREFIVERMQEMQAQGSPPNDLVGDMDDAQKALGDMDSNCAQQ